MSVKTPAARTAVQWGLPVAVVLLLGWAGTAAWRSFGQPTGPYRLTLSAGESSTTRRVIGERLARSATCEALDVEIRETNGSEEILDLLEAGDLDVGLVSGGFSTPRNQGVRQLAAIGSEVLHMLVRPELDRGQPLTLDVLRNRRVNVGARGSGVRELTRELFEFAGLRPGDDRGAGDFVRCDLSYDELTRRCRAIQAAEPADRERLVAELPDVIFVLNAMPSRVATEIVRSADYRLAPVPFAKVLQLRTLHRPVTDAEHLDRRQISTVEIPARLYRAAPASPAVDIETIGVPLLVVAREEASAKALQPLLATLYDGPFSRDLPPLDPLQSGSVYPIHAGVEKYFASRRPVEVQDLIDLVQRGFSIFGAFSAGVLAVYGYYRRRRDVGPHDYMNEIGRIQRERQEGLSQDADDESVRELLGRLEVRLARLKLQLIQDYAARRMIGDFAFANLMTLIADTQQQLSSTASDSRRDASQPALEAPGAPRLAA